MKEKAQAGKMNNTVPTRDWKSPDKEVSMTVGYSDDESKAEWLTHENEDASMTYFDKDADGSVDRGVINKEDLKPGAPRKSLHNQFKIFDSMQNLANEADMLSGLKPENVKVYEISFENENFVIRAVDFKSGEASEFDGPDAAELAGKVQGAFTNSMEKVDGQLKK